MLFRGIFVEDPRNIICTKLQNIWFLKFQPIRKKNYPWHQKNKFQIKTKWEISVKSFTNIICTRIQNFGFPEEKRSTSSLYKGRHVHLFRFQANQSFLLILNAVCIATNINFIVFKLTGLGDSTIRSIVQTEKHNTCISKKTQNIQLFRENKSWKSSV